MLRAGVFSSESVVNSWGQAYKPHGRSPSAGRTSPEGSGGSNPASVGAFDVVTPQA